MELKEFKVNDFILLKLENGNTNIYLNGHYFRQCKYLPIKKLHLNQLDEFITEFTSIDEIVEVLDNKLELDKLNERITPETEFWAHCSNLQVWAESEYDTNLLHRNLAFPLLKGLMEAGDPLAKLKFNEEIAGRLESGVPSVINYLIENKYTQNLSREDFFSALLKAEDAMALLELEQNYHEIYGWVENFETLRSITEKKHTTYFAIKNKKIIELELFFSKTSPNKFPNLINKFDNLKTLYIHLNEYTDLLPPPKVKLQSLEELRIFSYGETTLPDSFDKFPNLKRLYIYGGYFETTPDSITTLRNLKLLLINRTSLRHLPDFIDNLMSLETLNLRYCNLWTLPKAITKLKNIIKLEVNSDLLDEKINEWVKSLDLVKTSEITASKNKYIAFKKILI